MTSVAVFSGKPDSIHIPDGRGVLIEALRGGVDVTDKETGAARYGGAPKGYEAETPERVAREAVETRTVNREHAPDGRIDVRDGSFRNGYLCRSW
jgi:hypothetical protein